MIGAAAAAEGALGAAGLAQAARGDIDEIALFAAGVAVGLLAILIWHEAAERGLVPSMSNGGEQ